MPTARPVSAGSVRVSREISACETRGVRPSWRSTRTWFSPSSVADHASCASVETRRFKERNESMNFAVSRFGGTPSHLVDRRRSGNFPAR